MTSGGPGSRNSQRKYLVVLLLGFFGACASAPPYAEMDPEELWEAGSRAYGEEDWDGAIQVLERLVNQNPGHPREPEARLHVARAYARRGEYITAASEFQRFLQIYGSHGLAPEASLGACQAYAELAPHPQRDQAYTTQAREACEQTWLEFRGLTVAESADSIRVAMVDLLAQSEYEDASFYQDFSMHNSAIMLFEEVATRYPDTEWAPRALLEIYRSYISLGWGPEAEETSTRLFGEYPDSEPARELGAEISVEENPAGDAGVDR